MNNINLNSSKFFLEVANLNSFLETSNRLVYVNMIKQTQWVNFFWEKGY
ncbi:MAG: hypothetical protein K6E99_00885 [Bacilli bacterium]|nr:hypothetical protein [Bacilli bacterium]